MGKILKGIVAIIFVLAIVGFIMVTRAGEDTPEMASAVSFMVNIAFFLLIATVIVAILASIIDITSNREALKNTIIGLVAFAVILGISYAISKGTEVLDTNKDLLLEAGSVSKWSEAGLTVSLILLTIGGIFFVFDLVKGLIKS